MTCGGHGGDDGIGYLAAMTASASLTAPVGAQIRHWRARRRLSQLELALEADVSTRHLSCLETGRAAPSREMILRLARPLDVPLRERNRPAHCRRLRADVRRRPLDDPALAAARARRRPGAARPRAVPGARRRPALERRHAEPRRGAAARRRRAGAARGAGQRAASEPAPARAWRRASSTSASGAPTCSRGCASRSTASDDDALRALAEELAAYPAPGDAAHADAAERRAGARGPARSSTRALGGSRSSARRRCSARRSTSRSRSWRSNRSSRPTRRPPPRCAPRPRRRDGDAG